MKKMRVLALVLVFAFAALGGAYAMWSDTLFIDESVNTGILDMEWGDTVTMVDPEPNYEGYDPDNVYGTDGNKDGIDTMDPGNPNSVGSAFADHKNVGFMNGEVAEIGSSDKKSNQDQLIITLDNGYPGYQELVGATIKNVGTVPAKFTVIPGNIPDWLIVEIRNQSFTENATVYFNSQIGPNTLEGMQIEPGAEIPVFIVNRVLQTAPQDANRTFTLQLKAIQWNEYSADGQYVLPNQITFPRDDIYPYHDGFPTIE